jgi:hypothetical protein
MRPAKTKAEKVATFILLGIGVVVLFALLDLILFKTFGY